MKHSLTLLEVRRRGPSVVRHEPRISLGLPQSSAASNTTFASSPLPRTGAKWRREMQTRERRNTSLILWLLVIAVAAGGLYLFINGGSQKPSTPVINDESVESTPAPTDTPAAKASASPDAKASNSPAPSGAGGGSGGGGGTSGLPGPLTPIIQAPSAPEIQPIPTPIPIKTVTPAPTAIRPIMPTPTAPRP